MDSTLRELVRQRAGYRCEYCQIPQECDILPFQIDHIISLKHRRLSDESNLALSCYHCNIYKGPNIAGIDEETGEITRLFHPRRDQWAEHFDWNSSCLLGHTAIGRATINVLSINLPERAELRRILIELGVDF